LLGQLEERSRAGEVAMLALQLVSKDLRDREVLEDSDDVGDRLVESEDVEVGRLVVVTPQAMDDGMCHLVRDDVVG
jgi:hypothetical protein